MPKLQNFFVEFDNPQSVFFGGHVITGRVVIMLNEGMKMRNVRINFHGGAHNHWTETRHTGTGDNRRTQHIRYSADEVYVDLTMLLWGTADGSAVMEPGSFQFPFQFQLPPICPTSFEGPWGSIRYSCSAVIDKPWKFDHKTRRVLTVIGLQDLNLDPNARRPIQLMNQKTLGAACCKAGDIQLTVKVAKMGFVPGETMLAFIDATNHSTRTLKRIQIKVVQCTRFVGHRHGFAQGFAPHNKERFNTQTMFESELNEEIEAGGSRQLNGEPIYIPPCPDMLLACNIIHIDYILKVKLVPHGMSTSLEIEAPFIVGTVPLQDAFASIAAAPVSPDAPPSPPPPSEYNELPPPSYEESVFGRTSVREEDEGDFVRGDSDFAPRYPSYNFPKPSAPPLA